MLKDCNKIIYLLDRLRYLLIFPIKNPDKINKYNHTLKTLGINITDKHYEQISINHYPKIISLLSYYNNYID